MNRPALAGFRPEPLEQAARHWSFDAVRGRVRLAASIESLSSDLRPDSSPRHDQTTTNSCVAQALIKALEIKRIQHNGRSAHIDLSRLTLYYLARELMDPSETARDDGTFVSMGAEVLRRFGVCAEVDWPFRPEQLYTAPSWRAMRNAYTHKIQAWYRISSIGEDRVEDVITNLAVGNPVVFGTSVDDGWVDYQAGQVLGPLRRPAIGRHATVIVGWQPGLQGGVFLGENSWGTSWGDDGFYYLSPDVVASAESSDYVIVAGGWEEWAR